MCQSGSPVITGADHRSARSIRDGRYSSAGSGSPGSAAARSHAAAPPCGSAVSSKRLRIRAASITRSRPANVARCRACSAGVPGSSVRSRGPSPSWHAARRHLPCPCERGEGVASVAVGDQPARQDEVLGIRELAWDCALTLPSCPAAVLGGARLRVDRSTARRGSAVRSAASRALGRALAHSHSMVPGGLLVTSSTTRLTSRTSFVMRFEMRASTSYGNRVQSAVIASSDETGRSTIGCP